MTQAVVDAIVVEGLAKRFETVDAVAGISFCVQRGELFGFLGPNGAGKSTTINLLTGLARPDAGSIRLGGIDCTHRPRAAQHLIGVVPDESNLYPELSGYENLTFCGALYGMARRERETRARALLDVFGLTDAAARKFGGYSKGMKRKLTIAAGIIHRPQILFLDEPTTGIDVASARQLRQLIAELHHAGTTLFLTTHYIEEAERLCERIAFIVAGRIVRIDSVARLLAPLQGRHRVRITSANGQGVLPDGLAETFPGLAFTCPEPGVLEAEAGEAVRVGAIVRWLEERGIEVLEARRLRPSLEDVFVRVTGIATEAMRQDRERAGVGR